MNISRRYLLFLVAVGAFLAAPSGSESASGGADALAKVGPELRALYEAYTAAHERGDALVLHDSLVRVVEDRVIVDAVASDGVEALKARLVALGMQGAVSAGRIVSGQLPISQIPAMAALPELRYARAAMSTTH
jgi:hypothetical protein